MKIDLKSAAYDAAKRLSCSDAPLTEAYELINHVFGFDKTSVITDPVREVESDDVDAFYKCIKKRASGYPLQYIIGEWDFYGYTFLVKEGVLIPRPETEQIADKACRLLKSQKDKVIFDLCAGSGCIGLSVAANNPECKVFLFDISQEAIECQKRNSERLGLDNAAILDYDIFYGFDNEKLPEPDVILCNPPYINERDMAELQREVRYEPELALFGGSDGLDFYRCLSEKWLPYINKNGFFMLECGEEQPERVVEFISNEKLPFECKCEEDIYGVVRFVYGERF